MHMLPTWYREFEWKFEDASKFHTYLDSWLCCTHTLRSLSMKCIFFSNFDVHSCSALVKCTQSPAWPRDGQDPSKLTPCQHNSIFEVSTAGFWYSHGILWTHAGGQSLSSTNWDRICTCAAGHGEQFYHPEGWPAQGSEWSKQGPVWLDRLCWPGLCTGIGAELFVGNWTDCDPFWCWSMATTQIL